MAGKNRHRRRMPEIGFNPVSDQKFISVIHQRPSLKLFYGRRGTKSGSAWRALEQRDITRLTAGNKQSWVDRMQRYQIEALNQIKEIENSSKDRQNALKMQVMQLPKGKLLEERNLELQELDQRIADRIEKLRKEFTFRDKNQWFVFQYDPHHNKYYWVSTKMPANPPRQK